VRQKNKEHQEKVALQLTVVSGKGRINGTRMTQIWRIIADKT